MKETSFIQQNQEKWKRFEELRKSGNADPDELSKLFVEITEDLSYARTFYPKRSVRVYLNYLAQGVFAQVYKIKTKPFKKFIEFWSYSLPLELYRSRWNLLYAFLFFAVSMVIGIVSTADDISFARVILSDSYVEMTNSFIEEGDPMKVYKSQDGLPMFLGIFFNNIQVAFLCFILGIFFSIGTLFFIVFNGVMVGTFQSYFYFKGLSLGAGMGAQLLLTSFLTIWIHGAFEISAIVIAGAAGLTVGNGLLFPGTYTRAQSLQITGRRGMKIMVGLIPFFLIAAIFESWITRLDMPNAGKWMIIIGSFAIVLLYFVVLPFIVARRFPGHATVEEEPLAQSDQPVELQKIRQSNELFSDSFLLLRKIWKYISKPLWQIILPVNLLLPVLLTLINPDRMNVTWSAEYFVGQQFPMSTELIWPMFFTAFFWSLNAATVISAFVHYSEKATDFSWRLWKNTVLSQVWKIFPVMLLLVLWMQQANDAIVFLGCFLVPVVLFIPYFLSKSKSGILKSYAEAISVGFRTWTNGFLLLLFFGLIGFCTISLLSGSVMLGHIIKEIIQWHFTGTYIGVSLVNNFIEGILIMAAGHFLLTLMIVGYALIFHGYEEKEKGIGLFRRMENFGKKSRSFETEVEFEDR